MYTNPKGITRTLQLEVEQVGKHLEIDIDLTTSGKVKGEPFGISKTINISQYEASILIDKLMPYAKPGKIIITKKPAKV